jgi:hypothetical protein
MKKTAARIEAGRRRHTNQLNILIKRSHQTAQRRANVIRYMLTFPAVLVLNLFLEFQAASLLATEQTVECSRECIGIFDNISLSFGSILKADYLSAQYAQLHFTVLSVRNQATLLS